MSTGPEDPHNGDDEDRESSRDHPASESLPDDQRVDDTTWSSFVDNIHWHTSPAPDVMPEEVRDVLDDADWVPPEPEPIGWRTTSPSLVLGLIGALGGAFVLFVITVFFRPVPGWLLLIVIAVIVASAAVLFSHLPSRRDPFSDGREV